MTTTNNSLISDNEGVSIRRGKNLTIAIIVLMVLMFVGTIVYISSLNSTEYIEAPSEAPIIPIVQSTRSKQQQRLPQATPSKLSTPSGITATSKAKRPPQGKLNSIPEDELRTNRGTSEREKPLAPGQFLI